MTSHASFCARACGIPEDVIERANYIKTLADNHELETLQLEALGLLDDDDEDGEAGGDGRANEARRKAKEVQSSMRRFIEWDIDAEVESYSRWCEEGGDEETLRDGVRVRDKLGAILQG